MVLWLRPQYKGYGQVPWSLPRHGHWQGVLERVPTSRSKCWFAALLGVSWVRSVCGRQEGARPLQVPHGRFNKLRDSHKRLIIVGGKVNSSLQPSSQSGELVQKPQSVHVLPPQHHCLKAVSLGQPRGPGRVSGILSQGWEVLRSLWVNWPSHLFEDLPPSQHGQVLWNNFGTFAATLTAFRGNGGLWDYCPDMLWLHGPIALSLVCSLGCSKHVLFLLILMFCTCTQKR